MTKVYAYVMRSDNGFAPYPSGELCTLACCKPRIRQAIGDSAVEEFKRALFCKLGFPDLQGNGVIKDTKAADSLLRGEAGNEELSEGVRKAIGKLFNQKGGVESWDNLKERCRNTFHERAEPSPATLTAEAKEAFTTALLEAVGFSDGLMTTAAIRECSKKCPSIKQFNEIVEGMDVYIMGLVGKTTEKKGRLTEGSIIYCMKVTDVMDYAEYWKEKGSRRPDHDYFEKLTCNDGNYRPANCGDNIYMIEHGKDSSIKATPSFHYFRGENPVPQMLHDLSGMYVLVSSQFVYYGQSAKNIKSEPLCKGRGHRVLELESLSNETKKALNEALKDARQGDKILGAPIGSNGKGPGWWKAK